LPLPWSTSHVQPSCNCNDFSNFDIQQDNLNSSTSDSDDDYDAYYWLDEDKDGVITDEEASVLADAMEEIFKEIESENSSSTYSSSSSSDVFVDEVTNHVDISTIDMTGASTNGLMANSQRSNSSLVGA
jgi:hypothetical protein